MLTAKNVAISAIYWVSSIIFQITQIQRRTVGGTRIECESPGTLFSYQITGNLISSFTSRLAFGQEADLHPIWHRGSADESTESWANYWLKWLHKVVSLLNPAVTFLSVSKIKNIEKVNTRTKLWNVTAVQRKMAGGCQWSQLSEESRDIEIGNS